jgi:hypothetical protein
MARSRLPRLRLWDSARHRRTGASSRQTSRQGFGNSTVSMSADILAGTGQPSRVALVAARSRAPAPQWSAGSPAFDPTPSPPPSEKTRRESPPNRQNPPPVESSPADRTVAGDRMYTLRVQPYTFRRARRGRRFLCHMTCIQQIGYDTTVLGNLTSSPGVVERKPN